MREIKVESLKIAFERIIEKLQFEKANVIEIFDDYYLSIPADKWGLSNKPEEVVVTESLYDDLESIEKLVHDKDRPCTYVDFDRVASILRAISQIRNPPGE